MTTWLKRSIWLVALVVATGATARWWSTRSIPAPASPPVWPPFDPVAPRVADDPSPTSPAAGDPTGVEASVQAFAGEAPQWVLPIGDGECPEGYPVKANDNSGIYHVPGGRFYDRTKAERCYADADSAAADGYRAAKS
jgi:hypothetical protein